MFPSWTDEDLHHGQPTRLTDWQIKALCTGECAASPMIEPFVERHSAPGELSHGLGPAGYDARLGYKFMVLKPHLGAGAIDTLDPLNFIPDQWETVKLPPNCDCFHIPPHGCILAETLETFNIPPTISATVEGKSTYARVFFKNHMTPLEPGWKGILTLEFTNLTPYNLKIYPGQGVCQIKFWRAHKSAEPYSGRYQNQTGVTPSRGDNNPINPNRENGEN